MSEHEAENNSLERRKKEEGEKTFQFVVIESELTQADQAARVCIIIFIARFGKFNKVMRCGKCSSAPWSLLNGTVSLQLHGSPLMVWFLLNFTVHTT